MTSQEAQLHTLRHALQQARKRTSDVKEDVEVLQDTLAMISSQKIEVENKIATLITQVVEAATGTPEHRKLQAQVDALNPQQQGLTKRLETAQAFLHEAEAKLKTAEAEVERIKQEYDWHRKTPYERIPNHLKPAPKPKVDPKARAIAQWREKVRKSFADYSQITITNFPTPPSIVKKNKWFKYPCGNDSCVVDRILPVCKCDIRAAFAGVEGLDLKKERRSWHPDRFGKCPEKQREEIKKMTEEVFVVVDEMYDEIKDDDDDGWD